MSGMLSSMARSPMGRDLLQFMDAVGINETWENPPSYGVEAFVTGRRLDNQEPSKVVISGHANDELLLHLRCERGDVEQSVILNVNTLLALAVAYINDQYTMAESVVGHYRND